MRRRAFYCALLWTLAATIVGLSALSGNHLELRASIAAQASVPGANQALSPAELQREIDEMKDAIKELRSAQAGEQVGRMTVDTQVLERLGATAATLQELEHIMYLIFAALVGNITMAVILWRKPNPTAKTPEGG